MNECFANEDGAEHDGQWYCADCAPDPHESDDSEAVRSPRHISRAGRDESPNQLELTLRKPGEFFAGDIVKLADNTRAQQITVWRARSHADGYGNYPAWEPFEILTVEIAHDNGNITLTNGETWEADGFILADGGTC